MDTTEAAPAQLICHCSVQPPRLHSSHAVGVLVLDELGKRPDVFKCAHVAKADAHAAEGHVNPLESHLAGEGSWKEVGWVAGGRLKSLL